MTNMGMAVSPNLDLPRGYGAVKGEVNSEAVIQDVSDEVAVQDEQTDEPNQDEHFVTFESQDQPHMLTSPSTASRQEVLEHNISHCPFRAWCKHCVAGKAKSMPHKKEKDRMESEVPLVAFDDALVDDKSQDDEERDEERTQVKILVARDMNSKVYASILVPQKGADNEGYAVRRVLRFLDALGYEKLVPKSDQERALGSVLKNVMVPRGEHT